MLELPKDAGFDLVLARPNNSGEVKVEKLMENLGRPIDVLVMPGQKQTLLVAEYTKGTTLKAGLSAPGRLLFLRKEWLNFFMTGQEHGVQPLHLWMQERDLDNHALLQCATEPLTHKMIQKARNGRELTSKIRQRILTALQIWYKKQDAEAETKPDYPKRFTDLFSYWRNFSCLKIKNGVKFRRILCHLNFLPK
jgi:hypothetical protein